MDTRPRADYGLETLGAVLEKIGQGVTATLSAIGSALSYWTSSPPEPGNPYAEQLLAVSKELAEQEAALREKSDELGRQKANLIRMEREKEEAESAIEDLEQDIGDMSDAVSVLLVTMEDLRQAYNEAEPGSSKE